MSTQTVVTGSKNLKVSRSIPGREVWISQGGLSAAGTLDGTPLAGWICPPGKRYAVRQAIIFVGTRAAATATGTSAAIVDLEIVPYGTAVGSGTNLNGTADNTGVKVGSSTDSDVSADGKWAFFTIDDRESFTVGEGVNIVNPGGRICVETSGTLTSAAGIQIQVLLEELPAIAGS